VRVDTRVITATNSDLDRKIEAGQFRRDLYYRVAGFVLRVPPLRECRDDLPALVQAFRASFAREVGKEVPGITAPALRALALHSWPGNVRELEHEMRRLAYVCPEGEAIEPGMLSEHILLAPAEDAGEPPSSLRLQDNVDHLERRLIRAALVRTAGRRAAAARVLGISRNGLAIKMGRLGVVV
jgi:DNA-binding NtrC family response regulator